MGKDIYVLGTGLSHDGSACLLKNGKVCVAIEKERLTRKKHDGYNDAQAIQYCLDAEGIAMGDLALVVQNANFGVFRFGNGYFRGPRPFADDCPVPVTTISHHLAHAYSAIGTCPFDDFNVLVIDGTGSPYEECSDLADASIPDRQEFEKLPLLHAEKDSYYRYGDRRCRSLYKDFSDYGYFLQNQEYLMFPPLTRHSIGGVYDAASRYCFRNLSDAGKLMGLSPYGRPGVFQDRIFELRDGRVFVNYDWMESFRKPVRQYRDFTADFPYYADLAYWIQREVERAILYVVESRMELDGTGDLCFAGGVGLNAVANSKILSCECVKHLHIPPAAGDNGLSIGCAYYGWIEVLQRERVPHDRSTCFGMSYPANAIARAINVYNRAPDLFFKTIGRHYSPAAPADCDRRVRFRLARKGQTHDLVIKSNGLLEYSDSSSAQPTCEIVLDNTALFQTVFRTEIPDEVFQLNELEISNPSELQALLGMLDLEAISKALRVRFKEELAAGGDVEPRPDPDYLRKTAELLAQGKIIGWFQDGSEFGPRALGRRSILADPRNPAARTFINSKIKFREDFRPFAPSVLREDVSVYFQNDRESPYMLLVDQIRAEWRAQLKSIVHEDGSCRIQTVTEDWNPKYCRLLQEFKRLTGISVLLNTSFNCRGMPIVETPEEALHFFHLCRLDVLVMHDFIVEK